MAAWRRACAHERSPADAGTPHALPPHMRFSLHLVLVVAAAVPACGTRGDIPFDPGPPIAPRATGPEPPTLRIAFKEDAAYVAMVHADTGEAVPYGPALPVPGASTGYIPTLVFASPARVIVAVADSRHNYASVVLVGDGVTWREIARAPSSIWATSDDGTGVVLSRSCDPAPFAMDQMTFATVELDGPGSYRDLSCATSDSPSALLRAPGGAYILLQRGDAAFVRTRDGREKELVGTDLTKYMHWLFEKSFVTVHGDDEPAWFDGEGSPLVVPPTEGAAGGAGVTAAAAYVPAHGTLWRFRDRQAERLQSLPAWVAPRTWLQGAAFPGHYSVVGHDTEVAVLGLDGAVLETYSAGPPYQGVDILANALEAPWPWVVVRSNHFTPTVADDVGESTDIHALYLPGDPASGTPPQTRVLARDAFLRTYWPSATGRYLCYIGGRGDLHSIDIATQTDVGIGGFDFFL